MKKTCMLSALLIGCGLCSTAQNPKDFRPMEDVNHVTDLTLDSLEKALELSQNPEDPMIQGVQATYRQFVQAMEKSGMTEIDPVGEKFDPTRHQAIAMVPAQEGQVSGQVAQVFQRGWLISDRVLRAAMVSVVQ